MFRSILAYFLILTMVVTNSSRLFVYAGFELNQNYIITKLCVNRDKPQLHCNGKCYLMRKLKQAEEKEKSREHENQRSFFQLGIITERFTLQTYAFDLSKAYKIAPAFLLPQRSSDIFQPPRV